MAVVSRQLMLERYWRPTVTYCRPRVRPALGLLAVIALSIGLTFAPLDYKAMGNYGYLGVFVVTLLATGAIVLPVPYLALILVAGTFLNPVLVALVAGVAAALGEMTGYLVGYTGRSLLPKNRWYNLVERGITRYGGPVIFVAAAIPNPFFDAVGIVAGATRMPLGLFWIACFLGKTVRFWLIAAAASTWLAH
ncbi:MAG TPA: VTT domain-containing protein [Chloroflexota bacterium]|nr:VTT domain-containing protein [Chloroflexota bacterium]